MSDLNSSYVVAMIPRSKSSSEMSYHSDPSIRLDMRSVGVKDWRTAISTPLTYRIGNSTLHFRSHMVVISAIVLFAILLLAYTSLSGKNRSNLDVVDLHIDHGHVYKVPRGKGYTYDTIYPLTPTVRVGEGTRFKIAVVADPDKASRVGEGVNSWVSHLKFGHLTLNDKWDNVSVTWETGTGVEMKSSLSSGGRGMELSELSVFNGKVYTLDDRTGVVYEVKGGNRVVPWVILSDGDGGQTKGFKGEWSTVKGDRLIVGGLGKEWTTSQGEIINRDPMWVKSISPDGEIEHIDWRDQYEAVRTAAGVEWPGYMIHEAVCWSQQLGRWVFLPRRVSKERYDDVIDERKGTNLLILADEDFSKITVSTLGPLIPTHGFSSFKFVPGTKDSVIVALKSEEVEDKIATYLTVFNIVGGNVLYPETKIGNAKYEGIEFV